MSDRDVKPENIPSAKPGAIGALLAAVMSEVGAIGKNRKNPSQGYQFRGVDDFANALHPLLAKHQVVLRPRVLESKFLESHQTKSGGVMFRVLVTLELAFCAPDGSEHIIITAGEGADTGDKSVNKATSAALKYGLSMTFLVPTDLVDSEQDSHEAHARRGSPPKRAPKGPAPKAPPKPEEREPGADEDDHGPPPGVEADDLRDQIRCLLERVPPEKRPAVEKSLAKAGDNVVRLKAGLAFVKGLLPPESR